MKLLVPIVFCVFVGLSSARLLNTALSLDSVLHTVTSEEFGELIKKVRQNILDDETVSKIREYVLNLKTDNPLLEPIKDYVRKLNDEEFRELLRFVYQRRRFNGFLQEFS